MRKGYLIVSNGVGGDEGLTGFMGRWDCFAAMRHDGESIDNDRARTTADPLRGMTTRKAKAANIRASYRTKPGGYRTVDLVVRLLFWCGVGRIQG